MNKDSTMATDDSSSGASTEVGGARPGVAVDRRRLLRGGLGAVPVILTVASPSVMAGGGGHHGGGGICTPASSFASINASRPGKMSTCGGCKPDYWAECEEWPSPCRPRDYQSWKGPSLPATKFHDEFDGRYCGTMTMLAVLKTTDRKYEVARYCAAALLNARSGKTPPDVLSIGTVKSVWTSYIDKGYYEPTAGIQWYPDRSFPAGSGSLLAWLESTMPA